MAKQKGWLDKYGEEINANEGPSSASKEWMGEGYSTEGRNYSPAWGGQFEDGGYIPQAQTGEEVAEKVRCGDNQVYLEGTGCIDIRSRLYKELYESGKLVQQNPDESVVFPTSKPLVINSKLTEDQKRALLRKDMQETSAQNQTFIGPATEQSWYERAFDIATHPGTAIRAYNKKGYVPNNLGAVADNMGGSSSIINTLSPFTWAKGAYNAGKQFGSAPIQTTKDVIQGTGNLLAYGSHKLNESTLLPGQTMSDFKSPFGDAGTNARALEFVGNVGEALPILDIAPIIGGAVKSGLTTSMESGLLSKAHRLNPRAFKPNPEAYYRGIGKSGLEDAMKTGVFRQAGVESGIPNFKRVWYATGDKGFERASAFSDGLVAEVPKTSFPDASLDFFKNSMGVDTRATSKYIPITEGNILKKDWWQGYKQVPTSTPSKGVGNIFSSNKESMLDDWLIEEMRFSNLPELNNSNATEVLENFKKRISTPEGQRRLKELGITETEVFDRLKIVGDKNGLAQYWLNKIGIHPELPEVKRVTRHEIEHGVQDAYKRSKLKEADKFKWSDLFGNTKRSERVYNALGDNITDIDKSLQNLELRKTPENVDWDAIKETRGERDPSELFRYMSDKQQATNYFASGSKGGEKSAFLGEVQQYMMDEGMIPTDSYVNITPEMVEKVYMDAMFDETGGGKYLRLFNIMKPTEANYKLISDNLNKMLTVTPIVGGAAAAATYEVEQKKQGGVVKDNRGYWNPNNWGKVVEIDSPDITMKGVDQDLIGISDEGDVQYMTPGKDYKFKGKKVREYPVGKNGVNQQDEKVAQQLDQLTNFTNYNKPTKGGWLENYN